MNVLGIAEGRRYSAAARVLAGLAACTTAALAVEYWLAIEATPAGPPLPATAIAVALSLAAIGCAIAGLRVPGLASSLVLAAVTGLLMALGLVTFAWPIFFLGSALISAFALVANCIAALVSNQRPASGAI